MSRRESTLRASDADRDAAADRLRSAWMEGRLDDDELEARLARVLRSRTYGELDRVLADLPASRSERGRPQLATIARGTFGLMLAVAVIVAVVAVATTVALAVAAWWTFVAVLRLVGHGSGGRGCMLLGRGVALGPSPRPRRAARL